MIMDLLMLLRKRMDPQVVLVPQDVVHNEEKTHEENNTVLAYGAKQVEYNLYCDHVESHPRCSDDHKCIITPFNFYNFLYYQSRQSKYSGNKKGKVFCIEGFDKIIKDPTWLSKKPMGWHSML